MSKFKLSRREFLKASAASLFLAGVPIPGYTKDKPPGTISVIILEGGMDGLTAVPPFGDPNLMKLRSGMTPDNFLKLNSFFGLHPTFKTFSALMAHNNAFVVHATNFPYTLRSHFEGQNLIEGGGLKPFNEDTGWLGRSLDLANLGGRALSLDMPLILRGNSDNDNYFPSKIRDTKKQLNSRLINALAMAHNSNEADVFTKLTNRSGGSTERDPASLARYAGQEMAKENGPLASVIRVGRFDTHAKQDENTNGQLTEQLGVVDDVISGYREGLGKAWDRSIILTLTEFGRTVLENGTWGTDHGYGSAGLLAGGAITKSGVLTQWPGLSKKDQFEQRDLMSTIDYRSVCAACIEKTLSLDHDLIASKVFYTPKLPRVYDHIFS
jgi:uncharacterized protein (DUF1501 family)